MTNPTSDRPPVIARAEELIDWIRDDIGRLDRILEVIPDVCNPTAAALYYDKATGGGIVVAPSARFLDTLLEKTATARRFGGKRTAPGACGTILTQLNTAVAAIVTTNSRYVPMTADWLKQHVSNNYGTSASIRLLLPHPAPRPSGFLNTQIYVNDKGCGAYCDVPDSFVTHLDDLLEAASTQPDQ